MTIEKTMFTASRPSMDTSCLLAVCDDVVLLSVTAGFALYSRGVSILIELQD